MKEIKGWCVAWPGNYPIFVADDEIRSGTAEQVAWNIALGYPSDKEIKRAKAKGARAFRAKIVEIEEDE